MGAAGAADAAIGKERARYDGERRIACCSDTYYTRQDSCCIGRCRVAHAAVQCGHGKPPDDTELAEKRRLVLPENSSYVHKRVKLMHTAAVAAADTDGVQRILDRYDAKKEEIRASLDSVFALLHPLARDQVLDDAEYTTMKATANAIFTAIYRAESKRVVIDCGPFTSQWETLTETQRRRYAAIAEIATSESTDDLVNK